MHNLHFATFSHKLSSVPADIIGAVPVPGGGPVYLPGRSGPAPKGTPLKNTLQQAPPAPLPPKEEGAGGRPTLPQEQGRPGQPVCYRVPG